ncbi:MAG: 1-acyl-sn-glycerol-3-phosphate acyltransferase [Alphaproteobacteria bacterium]|nr:1-acyl-sn-glycerol-3-phosphate acyltransferase [Alphaproteobacteria bacterium]
MKRELIASTIFNLSFFFVTAIICIICIPLLFLPQSWFIGAIKFWIHIVTILEKNILGLTYEVRGLENLPKTGSYLVAAKHQSAYETFKLHILFDNPAIILKKELLRIPLWGMYLKKSDVISIDRKTPERALISIEEGAHRVVKQGRPIIIFPQGTRVRPEQSTLDKPYKPGIARIQDTTNLPIIPLALNSGIFWPRSGWLKSSGTIIFEFLSPIEPGKSRKDLMSELEKKIENESSRLMNEAQINAAEGQKNKKSALLWLGILFILSVLYSLTWFKIADDIKNNYIKNIQKISYIQNTDIPVISGFPGKINLDVLKQTIQTDEGTLKIQNLHAEGWPIPFTPIKLKGDQLTFHHIKWKVPLVLEDMQALFTYKNDVIDIISSSVKYGDSTGAIKGKIDTSQKSIQIFDLMMTIENHQNLLGTLAKKEIIKPHIALFIGAGFATLMDKDNIVRVPITQRGRTLYAGPLPVAFLPE